MDWESWHRIVCHSPVGSSGAQELSMQFCLPQSGFSEGASSSVSHKVQLIPAWVVQTRGIVSTPSSNRPTRDRLWYTHVSLVATEFPVAGRSQYLFMKPYTAESPG